MPSIVNKIVARELTSEFEGVDGMVLVSFGGLSVSESEELRTVTVEVYFPSVVEDGLVGEFREIFDTATPGDRPQRTPTPEDGDAVAVPEADRSPAPDIRAGHRQRQSRV